MIRADYGRSVWDSIVIGSDYGRVVWDSIVIGSNYGRVVWGYIVIRADCARSVSDFKSLDWILEELRGLNSERVDFRKHCRASGKRRVEDTQ